MFPTVNEDPISTNEICFIVEEYEKKKGQKIEYTYKAQYGIVDKFIFSDKNKSIALQRI